MKSLKFRSCTLIAAALAASLSLQACNTVAGFGEDVSAGAEAVTDAADENKDY